MSLWVGKCWNESVGLTAAWCSRSNGKDVRARRVAAPPEVSLPNHASVVRMLPLTYKFGRARRAVLSHRCPPPPSSTPTRFPGLATGNRVDEKLVVANPAAVQRDRNVAGPIPHLAARKQIHGHNVAVPAFRRLRVHRGSSPFLLFKYATAAASRDGFLMETSDLAALMMALFLKRGTRRGRRDLK